MSDKSLEQRISELEKEIAALKVQVSEQPKVENICIKLDGKTLAKLILPSQKKDSKIPEEEISPGVFRTVLYED